MSGDINAIYSGKDMEARLLAGYSVKAMEGILSGSKIWPSISDMPKIANLSIKMAQELIKQLEEG